MGCSKHLCSAALLSSQQLSGEVADCTVKQVGAPFAAVYFSVFQIIKGKYSQVPCSSVCFGRYPTKNHKLD